MNTSRKLDLTSKSGKKAFAKAKKEIISDLCRGIHSKEPDAECPYCGATSLLHGTNPCRPVQRGARSGRSVVVYATQPLETQGQIPVPDEARNALASLTPFWTNFIPEKFRQKSSSERKPGGRC